MEFESLAVDGAFLIRLERRGDERGFFARMFCEREFGAAGLVTSFRQMNNSLSAEAGTLRGMHYQVGDDAETKVVRCVRGGLYDVVLDLRPGSRTFGVYAAAELTAENRDMMYVPKGCAHGFMTLEAGTEAVYMVDAFYAPDAERGVRWDDPAFGIEWPGDPVVLSEKDRGHPDFVMPGRA